MTALLYISYEQLCVKLKDAARVYHCNITVISGFFVYVVMVVALCERSLFSFLYFMYDYVINITVIYLLNCCRTSVYPAALSVLLRTSAVLCDKLIVRIDGLGSVMINRPITMPGDWRARIIEATVHFHHSAEVYVRTLFGLLFGALLCFRVGGRPAFIYRPWRELSTSI